MIINSPAARRHIVYAAENINSHRRKNKRRLSTNGLFPLYKHFRLPYHPQSNSVRNLFAADEALTESEDLSLDDVATILVNDVITLATNHTGIVKIDVGKASPLIFALPAGTVTVSVTSVSIAGLDGLQAVELSAPQGDSNTSLVLATSLGDVSIVASVSVQFVNRSATSSSR
jgi:hypothetical protein